MSIRKIENNLDWFFCLSNPLTYCYILGHLIGQMLKDIQISLMLFIIGMRQKK